MQCYRLKKPEDINYSIFVIPGEILNGKEIGEILPHYGRKT